MRTSFLSKNQCSSKSRPLFYFSIGESPLFYALQTTKQQTDDRITGLIANLIFFLLVGEAKPCCSTDVFNTLTSIQTPFSIEDITVLTGVTKTNQNNLHHVYLRKLVASSSVKNVIALPGLSARPVLPVIK